MIRVGVAGVILIERHHTRAGQGDSNMLRSSFGSTNGASINLDTGKPYGPDFPAITVRDIVTAEKALLDGLGVEHLVAVAGPSYGGYQAFQWAVSDPDFMDGIVAV